MKIVHISDIHINPDPILGLDPIDHFGKCLGHVESYQGDADRVIITGDLAHHGQPGAYQMLRERLAQSPLQGETAPRLLIGNHDNRENFIAAFPETPRDGEGFVQWTEDTPAGLFVYLDTVEAGVHWGSYDWPRRDWLARVLDDARAKGQPAYLFMHHNPTAVQVANADMIGIREEAAFKSVLRDYRDVIRHIFFGHCHFTLSGSVAGIPFAAPRSTNHVCWPDFSGNPMRMGYGEFQPSYNVVFIEGDDVVVHTIDFLEGHKVKWEETTADGWIAEQVG